MIRFGLLLLRRTGGVSGNIVESGDHLFADADCEFSNIFASEADGGNGRKY
jgi:hypothetical protein